MPTTCRRAGVSGGVGGRGFPPDRFPFRVFPPRKSGPRRRLFESLRALPATLVFYESPMRTAATLANLAATLGPGRRACVARELTKEHEEFARDTLGALAARYGDGRPLGEVTLVVEGASAEAEAETWDDEALTEKAVELLARGLTPRDAARDLAALSGRARREAYGRVARPAGGAAAGEPDSAGCREGAADG